MLKVSYKRKSFRQQHIATMLLEIEAVKFNAKNPFTYTSGMRSPIYCDMRLIMSHPDVRSYIIGYLLELISETTKLGAIDVISGTATAGVPIASWLSDRLHKPMIYVRDKPKKHGMANQVEGVLEPGNNVLVVEDIISSGKSSLGNVKAIRQNKAIVTGCIAIASYEMASSTQGFADARVPLSYLVPMNMVVSQAKSEGLFSKLDQVSIKSWLANPNKWVTDHGF